MQQYFVTGTDTEVGKTLVTSAILKSAIAMGKSTLGFKPVAAGCIETTDSLRNEDGLLLHEGSSIPCSYEEINPITLKAAIAPHIAAEDEAVALNIPLLQRHFNHLLQYQPDLLLTEGAGGWHVPLNQQETLADFCSILKLPVILVVAIRLGCLNHALLTVNAIRNSGLPLSAWVANCIDPQAARMNENITYLRDHIEAPLLGIIPFISNDLTAEGKAPLAIATEALDISALFDAPT